MDIRAYLAGGGRITAPGAAPPRYRAELMKIMATFVDSELAGSAGFADRINAGPGIAERIAAARIVAEKTTHAGRVLRLMGEFGADTARYERSHPWTARLARGAGADEALQERDMRLPVFSFPLEGWVDAVTMNLLMGTAVGVQLDDLIHVSYQPLSDAIREIAPVEMRHTDLAEAGLRRLLDSGTEPAEIAASIDYWWPRVAASFGQPSEERQALLMGLGLRRVFGDEQRRAWKAAARARLDRLGLNGPE